MENKLIYIIISIVIFVSFILFIWIRYGIQKSISQSYYTLEKERKGLGLIFIVVLVSFSLLASIAASNPWMFFASAGIWFTGAAPAFKEKLEGNVHYVGAVLGVIFGYVYIITAYHWDSLWFIVPSGLLCGIITLVQKNKSKIIKLLNLDDYGLVMYEYKETYTWWCEIIAYITIMIAI